MILSLQGCMAVGKTTAVRYLQENAPYVHISYEINTDIIDEVKQRQLDKNKYEDYLEIQKSSLKVCKHCGSAFVASRPNSVFCSGKCKNQYNVYKSRAKDKDGK